MLDSFGYSVCFGFWCQDSYSAATCNSTGATQRLLANHKTSLEQKKQHFFYQRTNQKSVEIKLCRPLRKHVFSFIGYFRSKICIYSNWVRDRHVKAVFTTKDK